jgi:hypothetical protein
MRDKRFKNADTAEGLEPELAKATGCLRYECLSFMRKKDIAIHMPLSHLSCLVDES